MNPLNRVFLLWVVGCSFVCVFSLGGYAGAQPANPLISYLEDIKKAVVFFGTEDQHGRPEFHATGVLVSVDDILHVVTARHVVTGSGVPPGRSQDLIIFFNRKNGTLGRRSVGSIQRLLGGRRIFNPDPGVDLAMIPFAKDPSNDDVKSLAESLFLSADRLYETAGIFFMSYQPGSLEIARVSPVFRGGMIAKLNGDGTFFIDATAFPGNSGGPVFIRPEPVSFGTGGVRLGGSELNGRFIGVVGQYIPYQELAVSAQTGRPRVLFEENTGLSRVWAVDYIREIIKSESFQRQIQAIKRKFPRGK